MPKDKIEVKPRGYVGSFHSSNFSPEIRKIMEDPNKEMRWCDPNKIDDHKNKNGFQIVPGNSESGTVKARGMVLMARSRELTNQSILEKDARTRQQTQAAKNSFRNDIERLSRSTGQNLHKLTENYDES